METVRHNKDGHVTGFDRLNIDPQTTKQRVLAELDGGELAQRIHGTQILVKQAITITEDPKLGATVHYAPNYQQLVADHKNAVAAYAVEYDRLIKVRAMYFQPRGGEAVVAADWLRELRERFAALGPGQKLTLEGEVVNVG